MDDFLGKKTIEQIKMIKAVLRLEDKTFSGRDVSELSGIESKRLGGGFMALANKYADYPPLILRRGRKKIERPNNKRTYVQLWRLNPDFPLIKIKEAVKKY